MRPHFLRVIVLYFSDHTILLPSDHRQSRGAERMMTVSSLAMAPHAALAAAAGFCKPCRKSAARCACDEAVKIARLSFFRTSIHDAM
jgi:hypothetical protein